MDSILNSIKKLLGIPVSNNHFDTDLIMFINMAFAVLHQLGVGPKEEAYKINDETNVWDEFIQSTNNIENVKTYVFMKTKLAFDPPVTGAGLESLKELIKENEWRLNVECDPEPYIIVKDTDAEGGE